MAGNQNPLRTIKLNAFQRAMCKWTALHPYNAVHGVELSKPLDRQHLQCAIGRALERIGFSEVRFDQSNEPTRVSLSNEPGKIEIDELPDSAAETLYREVEHQLNLPFLCGPVVHPFRWIVQDCGDSFVLMLTYFHVIADAESIVWLLRFCAEEYASRVQNRPASAISIQTFPDLPKPYLWHFLIPCVRRLIGIPAMALSMRRCFRTPLKDRNDFRNALLFFSVSGERIKALQSTVRSWGVTVNDLFLALLIKSVSGLASRRFASEKRKRIAVGCIANLRNALGFGTEPSFGVFLGSFFVTHECPEGMKIETLAREIRRQTALIKSRRLPLGTPVELGFGRLLFSFFSTERQKKLYHRNYPLWGGVTNMNLNALWPTETGSICGDYFRAVSTGPVTPLVLSTTTAGERLNIGMTYRTAVFSEADAQTVKDNFLKCINQL